MSQNINERVPSPLPARAISSNASGQTTAAGRPGVIFPNLERITGTYNSDPIFNPTARGVRLNLVIAPTGPATGTYSMQVQVPDPVDSTVWKTLGGTLGVSGGGEGEG